MANVDVSSFKPNSSKATAPEQRRVKRIVNGPVKKMRPPLWRRIVGLFLADDLEVVNGSIRDDVVIPAIKRVIADIVDTVLFGSARGGNRKGGNIDYASYATSYKYGTGNNNRNDASNSYTRTDYRDIVLGSRGEAEGVISALIASATEYGSASVADLYDALGVTGEFTDHQIGWTRDMLASAGVKAVRNGYLLVFPKVIQL